MTALHEFNAAQAFPVLRLMQCLSRNISALIQHEVERITERKDPVEPASTTGPIEKVRSRK